MKKLLILALFSFAALFVNAAAVVWKYTPSINIDPTDTAVKLVAWSGETAIDCQILTTMEGKYYLAETSSTEIYSIIPSDSFASLSFSVRLYSFDEDKEILEEESAKVTYYELYEKNAIFFDAATTPNPTAYDFAGAIPEPTSAMMLVFGLATLALKRRV